MQLAVFILASCYPEEAKRGQRDASRNKGVHCQVQPHESDPQTHMPERRGPVAARCPLTSTTCTQASVHIL